MDLMIQEAKCEIVKLKKKIVSMHERLDHKEHVAHANRVQVNKWFNSLHLRLRALLDYFGIPAPAEDALWRNAPDGMEEWDSS
ncbi:hypothetical protein GSI_05394 [Ganoderma sinense ZZ0214-1]|uniref:Uncharacterized protein n=1 Tax=Ganoderma sinense ZZ0214-1 TaxID=1077348 RepID=A0A2G8SG00_9APHY|nr:hypothetical protein GSI_05394 [Ganoderma sinense ZZ0214-1]